MRLTQRQLRSLVEQVLAEAKADPDYGAFPEDSSADRSLGLDLGSYESERAVSLVNSAVDQLRQVRKMLGEPSKSVGNLRAHKIVGVMVRSLVAGSAALAAELLGSDD